jgi:hypothetical protein
VLYACRIHYTSYGWYLQMLFDYKMMKQCIPVGRK